MLHLCCADVTLPYIHYSPSTTMAPAVKLVYSTNEKGMYRLPQAQCKSSPPQTQTSLYTDITQISFNQHPAQMQKLHRVAGRRLLMSPA